MVGDQGEGRKAAANATPPLPPLSPAPGSHTLSVALSRRQRVGAGGGAGAHSHSHSHSHSPSPARPPGNHCPCPPAPLPRGCFVGRRGAPLRCAPLLSAPLRAAPRRAAPERHIHYRPGAGFEPLPPRLHCSPGGQAPPPFVWRGGDWPAPGGGLPSPLGKPIHLCTWALDSASY